MPDLNRIACTRCQASVYSCMIEGPDGSAERVPLVIRLNVGKPADTGADMDLNGPNLRIPSVLRAMMQTPLARIELCVKCFAEVFQLPLVTATEDPMYDVESEAAQAVLNQAYFDESRPMTERANLVHTRALHALAVGWGKATAKDLPSAFRSRDAARSSLVPADAVEPVLQPPR